MPVSRNELERSRERDRRAVYVGAAVTAAVTPLLFVLPELVAPRVEVFKIWYHDLTGTWLRSENPFTTVRLFGGCIGGAAAGWMTSGRGSGAVTGMKAAVYGLVLAYIVSVVVNVVYWPIVVGAFPPPIYIIVVLPFIYAIPLFGSHLIGGTVAGAIADRLGASSLAVTDDKA